VSVAELWATLWAAGDDLAAELGLEAPPAIFTPARALPAADEWLRDNPPLNEEDTTRLCGLLFRVLVETHGGGLRQIGDGHELAGEWVLTGFESGLPADYAVPLAISAVRIGMDRTLTAADWYHQLLAEAR